MYFLLDFFIFVFHFHFLRAAKINFSPFLNFISHWKFILFISVRKWPNYNVICKDFLRKRDFPLVQKVYFLSKKLFFQKFIFSFWGLSKNKLFTVFITKSLIFQSVFSFSPRGKNKYKLYFRTLCIYIPSFEKVSSGKVSAEKSKLLISKNANK